MSRITQVTKKSKVSTVVKASPKTLIVAKPVETIVVSSPSAIPASSSAYTHNQATASSSWTITHNLGYFPGGVSVVDSAGTKVYGDVTFVSENQIVVNFNSAFGGKAYIS
ncbi:MAG: hypothetical protein FJ211_09970 [Ignavibacteria bacterium]|nr:hypothetical protein [Ignavibacteria bacterium]